MPMMNRKATLPDKQAIYQTNTPDRQANNLPDKHARQTSKLSTRQTLLDRQATNLPENHARQTSKQSTRQTLLDRQATNLPDKLCQTDKQTIYQTNTAR